MLLHRRFATRVLVSLVLCCSVAPSRFAKEPESDVIKISPSKLFSDNLERIEPHLGLTSGCVQLDMPQRPRDITVSLQLWKNGKVDDRLGTFTLPVEGQCEISISLRELDCSQNKGEYRIVQVVSSKLGGVTSNKREKLPPASEHAPVSFRKPVVLHAGQEQVIWAYLGGHSLNKAVKAHTPEEAAKSADWALVLLLKAGKRAQ